MVRRMPISRHDWLFGLAALGCLFVACGPSAPAKPDAGGRPEAGTGGAAAGAAGANTGGSGGAAGAATSGNGGGAGATGGATTGGAAGAGTSGAGAQAGLGGSQAGSGGSAAGGASGDGGGAGLFAAGASGVGGSSGGSAGSPGTTWHAAIATAVTDEMLASEYSTWKSRHAQTCNDGSAVGKQDAGSVVSEGLA